MVDFHHPLKKETPEKWNNIPICLVECLNKIFQSITLGGTNLFDYQMKSND